MWADFVTRQGKAHVPGSTTPMNIETGPDKSRLFCAFRALLALEISCLLASMLSNRSGLASELYADVLILKLFYKYSTYPSYAQILQTLLLLLQGVGESAMSYIQVNQEGRLDMTNEDLQEVLIRVLIDIGQTRPVFLLIYDINELDKKVDGLLLPFLDQLMKNACSADISLHVCYSKRDYPMLLLPRSMIAIQLQIRVDTYNQPDIQLHVEKKISKIYSRWKRDDSSSMTDQIIKLAGTGCVAANLYLDLCRRTIE
jgi:hypothetical protein